MIQFIQNKFFGTLRLSITKVMKNQRGQPLEIEFFLVEENGSRYLVC